jgi:transposase
MGQKAATAKPANGVTTGSPAKPAIEVTTGSEPIQQAKQAESHAPMASTASLSEPYRELIDEGLSRGRNAMSIWQELVDRHDFTGAYQSVRRYVRKLRGPTSPEARVVIPTGPGEDYGEYSVMVRLACNS